MGNKTYVNLSDRPITEESQDLLRRAPFVEALYQEITNLPYEDSFCFGIYGGWGEGKTSILNLLKNKLQKNQEIILFEFDPWYLASKETILKNFLQGLERKLKPISAKSKKIFEKYFRKLSIGASFLGTGGQIGWEVEKEGLSELKEGINSLIKKSAKKVLILVDDIDRLQPDEILLVFKLVRLIANFKHTIFVLSFDPVAVKDSLQEQNIDVDYIDKIVQKPISLPKIEQTDIDKFLDEVFNQLFKNLNICEARLNYEVETSFPTFYQTHAKRLFTTLRSVKRYINSLYSSLPPVINEIHLFDFMLLEMLKVFASKVYDDIFENWWFYVQTRSESETHWLNPLHLRFLTKEEERKEEIRKYIEGIIANEPREIHDILCELFPVVAEAFRDYTRSSYALRNRRQEKRICSAAFLKYFTLKVPSGELPDASVQGLISSWNETKREALESKIPKDLIKFQQKKKLGELFNKLILFRENISEGIAPIIIKNISKNSKRFSKAGWGFDTEFSRAEYFVFTLIDEKLSACQEILPFLDEVMSNSDSLDFVSGVYILCKQSNKRRPDQKWDVLKNARQTLVDKFKKDFVKPRRDFFLSGEPDYVLLRLLDLSSEVEGVSPKECSISKYILWLLDNNPKYLGKIINCYVREPIGLSINELTKGFDIDQLHKIAQTIDLTKCESEKEKEAVELFCKIYEESKKKSEKEETG